jgi:acetylornithine deacetylase/succinyl-diaminopimelate desuccinylase-like protein
MPSRQDAVALLDRYVRIPTVTRQVTPAMVDDVRAFWRDAGLALEPILPEDAGTATPALCGEIPGPPGARTVLLYGHYDVQPTGDPARWRWEDVPCEPFSPAYFRNGRAVDPRTLDDDALARVVMVARGGADNKGQHLANILGALAAARDGSLAWRVRVILDGEEEHGSPNLAAIARAHRDRLAADVLVASDGPMQRNRPTIVMGVRGLLGVELTAANGQRASVHSGNYGNIVPNPVLPLARLIEDIETRVHAYAKDHVAFQRAATEAFAKWEDQAVWKSYLRPTVNVNHFMSDGASPELRRTIIPRSAGARLDIRLTPDTAPGPIEAIVRAAVDDHQGRTPGVTFTAKLAGQPASSTSSARPEFGWLLRLLEEVHDAEPIALPTLGGTLPAWVFTEVLDIPSFWIPSANSDNQQHDVNEHYVLGCFFRQMALYRKIASSLPV